MSYTQDDNRKFQTLLPCVSLQVRHRMGLKLGYHLKLDIKPVFQNESFISCNPRGL